MHSENGTLKEESNNKSEKLQIGFWNVSGIGNKKSQFWDYTKEYDFIGFVETWVEEKNWDSVEKTLPGEFKWKSVAARREHKNGRAKGGIITGVKKHIPEEESEHAQERTITIHGKRYRIWTVYMAKEENIRDVIKTCKEEDAVIIGGDFNARIGERETGKEKPRKSKDKKTNRGGRELVKIVSEKNWRILNGATNGDEDGDFTFVGPSGSSVIDYAVTNSLALEDVERFEVDKRAESDHMPIKITLKINREEREQEKKKRHTVDAETDEEYLIKAMETLEIQETNQ